MCIRDRILPGGGGLLQKMKDLCKELECDQQVLFPGYCSKKEILSYYKKSNTAVVASNNETFGQCLSLIHIWKGIMFMFIL